jgi:hypothetical protein
MAFHWPATGFLRRLKAERARAHEVEQLLQLDDQTLADLGLERADIVHYICEGGNLGETGADERPPAR